VRLAVTHRLELKTVAIRDDGCFSAALWDGRPFAVALERTFEHGEAAHGKRIVVQAGLVLCRRDFYHKGGYETFEIEIPEHDRVLFHRGAIEEHSLACVILGESFGGFDALNKAYSQHAIDDSARTALLGSSVAFAEFMKLAEGLREFHMLVSGR
jgi:hypothetical protein